MKKHPPILLVSLLLGALTAVLYWPITRHRFVDLDDPTYVCLNSHVTGGLSWSGLHWAFTSGYASNWHPLTWISHMLDCQIFGLNPGGHHLTNLVLHALNSALVFLVFRRLTGAYWRSALIAALFAWHPAHVESVAWAAERKDVLSTLFFLLSVDAYARYVTGAGRAMTFLTEGRARSPRAATMSSVGSGLPARPHTHGPASCKSRNAGLGFYFLALLWFALGLMSKPMVVTLPFVLLLLDWWPLKRLESPEFPAIGSALSRLINTPHQLQPVGDDVRSRSVRENLSEDLRPPSVHLSKLILEKLPFFALSLAASVVTYLVQNAGGAVQSVTAIPLSARAANALVSYARYVFKTCWPAKLCVFYPLPEHWSVGLVLGATALLVGISTLVVRVARNRPYLFVGWFWFVGTLVPTIGLVQVGSQAMADRYLYIPALGLFLAAAWGLADWATAWEPAGRRAPWLVPGTAAVVLLACFSASSVQIRYWQSEETLFAHAAQAEPDNYLAYDHLAKVCEKSGRKADAELFYLALLRLKPHYPEGQYNLGTLEMDLGKLDEAAQHLAQAVALRPQFASAHANLGLTRLRQRRLGEAVAQLELAVALAPDEANNFVNLGAAQLDLNQPAEAATSFRQALRLKPAQSDVHLLLALALQHERRPAEALQQAQTARDLALASGQTDTAAKAVAFLRDYHSGTLISADQR